MRSSDLQSDSDFYSIRNSCDVLSFKMSFSPISQVVSGSDHPLWLILRTSDFAPEDRPLCLFCELLFRTILYHFHYGSCCLFYNFYGILWKKWRGKTEIDITSVQRVFWVGRSINSVLDTKDLKKQNKMKWESQTPDFSHFTKSDLYGWMSDSEILMAGLWKGRHARKCKQRCGQWRRCVVT